MMKKRVVNGWCRKIGFTGSLFLSLAKPVNIAKELGIDSKAIVKKCKDEGVPNIDTHMSPVSAGLAATIREWFASGDMKNAIESTQHVEAKKIQKAPRKRTSKKGASSDGSGHGSATALAEPPSEEEEPSSNDMEATGTAVIEEPASEVEMAPPPIAEAPVETVMPATVAEPAAEQSIELAAGCTLRSRRPKLRQ